MEAFANCGVGLAKALNTHTYGNGSQTIVLSYGIVSDQSIWHYMVPVLALYFQVLVYDLAFSPNVDPKLYNPMRYSNLSAYAHDLTCILDEHKVKNAIFLGHSMSGMIGCIAATKRPDLFKHLVLLNASPRYLNDTHYNGGYSRAQLDAIFTGMKTNYTGLISSYIRLSVGVNNATAITEIVCSILRMGSERALSVIRTGFLTDNRRVLPYVRVPTTIIQTEKDFTVPKSIPFYMKKRLRRARYVHVKILKTKGHYPMLTDPDLLLRVLKKTLGVIRL